jgi:SAM-dependent methyltransferase
LLRVAVAVDIVAKALRIGGGARTERDPMRDDPTRFVGSIPEHYDQGMGPVIFARPADLVATQVASFEPSRVLETAAGTGIVTRRLRDLLPAAAEIVATDLNPAMLDTAGRKFRPGEAVMFQPADATALPFADGEFDAMVCQFGVMFYPDKETAYREARRVLKPGGRYVFSVWDAVDHNPFARIVGAALRSAFASDPPPFLNVPFGYAALDPIKASLLANGFAGLRIDVVRTQGTIADFDAFANGLVCGSSLVDQIQSRGVGPEKLVGVVRQTLRDEFSAGVTPLQFIVFEASRE